VVALRTLLTQCTNLEVENRKLRASLKQEQAASSALLEELADARKTNEQTLAQIQSRSQALSR
jgi:regulator of replication initiation timing